MSLLFVDSFDHMGTSADDLAEKWVTANPAAFSFTVGGGRNGSNRLNWTTIGTAIEQGLVFPDEWYQVGWALRRTGTSNPSIGLANPNGNPLGFWLFNDDGSVSYWIGPNTTLGTLVFTSRPRLYHFNLYDYIEVRGRLHDTLGELHLYVNGKKEGSMTAIDTTDGLPLPQTRVILFASGGADDVYMAGSGGPDTALDATNDVMPGDVHVEARDALPDSTEAGFHQDWTPNSGTDHGNRVMDPGPHDGDTTTNESQTVGDIDTYFHADIAVITSGTIFGVQVNPTIRKDNPGNREVDHVHRRAGVDTNAVDSVAMNQVYQDEWLAYQRDPNGGGVWTIATVDASEFGLEVVA